MFSFARATRKRLVNKTKKFSTAVVQKPAVKYGIATGTLGLALGTWYFVTAPNTVEASANKLDAPEWPWYHKKPWRSLDHKAIRRGFKVYMTVGNNCHSQEYVYFRHLVNVAYSEQEMKKMAAEYEIADEPNDEGELNPRPRILKDPLPRPYANEQQARYANNGALPPDLSAMRDARPGGEDYLFSLLTGYCPPPVGLKVPEGMYYNPYFPGGFISMPPPLIEGMMEFDDGVEASISQMAKDVCTYLTWTAQPHWDERKKTGIKALLLVLLTCVPLSYWNRLKWSAIKNRRQTFTNTKRDAFF
eukprot:TRINITY_DN1942_c0_g1_i3.p1 TRINITY_DN1942_c0_g1~~TRINITY_DN1942_c0_g1_i3.p1  ORF type:complete len:303 (-),score=62.92 TRINITY_DN1942_c0_g1_i3:92-1000(-)